MWQDHGRPSLSIWGLGSFRHTKRLQSAWRENLAILNFGRLFCTFVGMAVNLPISPRRYLQNKLNHAKIGWKAAEIQPVILFVPICLLHRRMAVEIFVIGMAFNFPISPRRYLRNKLNHVKIRWTAAEIQPFYIKCTHLPTAQRDGSQDNCIAKYVHYPPFRPFDQPQNPRFHDNWTSNHENITCKIM